MDGWAWYPRTTSSAGRIYSGVKYISTDEQNYLDFDLRVRYEPFERPADSSSGYSRRLAGDRALVRKKERHPALVLTDRSL